MQMVDKIDDVIKEAIGRLKKTLKTAGVNVLQRKPFRPSSEKGIVFKQPAKLKVMPMMLSLAPT